MTNGSTACPLMYSCTVNVLYPWLRKALQSSLYLDNVKSRVIILDQLVYSLDVSSSRFVLFVVYRKWRGCTGFIDALEIYCVNFIDIITAFAIPSLLLSLYQFRFEKNSDFRPLQLHAKNPFASLHSSFLYINRKRIIYWLIFQGLPRGVYYVHLSRTPLLRGVCYVHPYVYYVHPYGCYVRT